MTKKKEEEEKKKKKKKKKKEDEPRSGGRIQPTAQAVGELEKREKSPEGAKEKGQQEPNRNTITETYV